MKFFERNLVTPELSAPFELSNEFLWMARLVEGQNHIRKTGWEQWLS